MAKGNCENTTGLVKMDTTGGNNHTVVCPVCGKTFEHKFDKNYPPFTVRIPTH